MRTIWKFKLDMREVRALQVPDGAVVRALGVQDGIPCLWLEVDTDAPVAPRTVWIRGTGHPVPSTPNALYVGTFMLAGGSFVGHVWIEALSTSLEDLVRKAERSIRDGDSAKAGG